MGPLADVTFRFLVCWSLFPNIDELLNFRPQVLLPCLEYMEATQPYLEEELRTRFEERRLRYTRDEDITSLVASCTSSCLSEWKEHVRNSRRCRKNSPGLFRLSFKFCLRSCRMMIKFPSYEFVSLEESLTCKLSRIASSGVSNSSIFLIICSAAISQLPPRVSFGRISVHFELTFYLREGFDMRCAAIRH